MSLLDDMKTLDYGAKLAGGLIQIGKDLGEARRREEADAAVSQVFSSVARSRDPFAFMKPENVSLLGFLQTTPEGQQAAAGAAQGLGMTKAASDIEMSRTFDVGYGQTKYRMPDQRGGTPEVIAEGRDRPASAKREFSSPTEKEMETYPSLRPTVRRIKNSTGALSDVIQQKWVLRDPATQEIILADGEPVTRDREVKQAVGSDFTPGGGGGKETFTDAYIPEITRPNLSGTGGTTQSEKASSKTLEGRHIELQTQLRIEEEQARQLGQKSQGVIKELLSNWGIIDAPPTWDSVMELLNNGTLTKEGIRKKLAGDMLLRYFDSHVQNLEQYKTTTRILAQKYGIPESEVDNYLKQNYVDRTSNAGKPAPASAGNKSGSGKPKPGASPTVQPAPAPARGTGLQFIKPGGKP